LKTFSPHLRLYEEENDNARLTERFSEQMHNSVLLFGFQSSSFTRFSGFSQIRTKHHLTFGLFHEAFSYLRILTFVIQNNPLFLSELRLGSFTVSLPLPHTGRKTTLVDERRTERRRLIPSRGEGIG
jgi:hypothetical protein